MSEHLCIIVHASLMFDQIITNPCNDKLTSLVLVGLEYKCVWNTTGLRCSIRLLQSRWWYMYKFCEWRSLSLSVLSFVDFKHIFGDTIEHWYFCCWIWTNDRSSISFTCRTQC